MKILVIEAIELVDALVKIGYDPLCIHYASTSLQKRYAAEKRYDMMGTLDLNILIDTYRAGKKKARKQGVRHMARLSKKFDYILMNPPYEQGLHIDFLNMACDMGDRVSTVQPSTPFINRKPTVRNAEEQDLVGVVKKYDTTLELVDGFDMFGAAIEAPLAVVHIDTTTEKQGVTFRGESVDFDHITVAGPWAARFVDLIQDDNLHTNANRNKSTNLKETVTVREGAWYVNQCWKRGGNGWTSSDFYTMFPADKTPENTRSDQTGWLSWAFDSEQEAHNFINYGKTKFARFMLSLYKMNGHIEYGELAAVPWLDFTQEWTDEKLCKKFKITADEWKKINNFIPDYY